jgi:hypothetical protein
MRPKYISDKTCRGKNIRCSYFVCVTQPCWQSVRLYTFDRWWVSEYGVLVEWYWQGKLKYWKKNIIQCGWYMIEWVWSIGGMILTGETEILREKYYTMVVVVVVDEWMNMEQWWNDNDRGNWSTGWKALYIVGGRWLNEYGVLGAWYWQGKLKYWVKNNVQHR